MIDERTQFEESVAFFCPFYFIELYEYYLPHMHPFLLSLRQSRTRGACSNLFRRHKTFFLYNFLHFISNGVLPMDLWTIYTANFITRAFSTIKFTFASGRLAANLFLAQTRINVKNNTDVYLYDESDKIKGIKGRSCFYIAAQCEESGEKKYKNFRMRLIRCSCNFHRWLPPSKYYARVEKKTNRKKKLACCRVGQSFGIFLNLLIYRIFNFSASRDSSCNKVVSINSSSRKSSVTRTYWCILFSIPSQSRSLNGVLEMVS